MFGPLFISSENDGFMNIESSMMKLPGIAIPVISASDFLGSEKTPVIAEKAAVSGDTR